MDQVGTVHVPPCDLKLCQVSLKQLEAKLTEAELKCIHNYEPNKVYKDQFEQYMKDAKLTIFHKCPKFWKKIQNLMGPVQEAALAGKLMFISFDNVAMQAAKPAGKNPDSDYENFFELFCISNIATNQDMVEFVNKTVDTLFPPNSQTTPNSNAAPGGPDETGTNILPFNQRLQSVGHRQDMVRVLDEFGEESHGTDVYARKECWETRRGSPVGSSEYSSTDVQQINSWRGQADNQQKIHHMLHTDLPKLFSNKKVVNLAHLAVCSLPELQERAHTFLELLLLQGGLEGSSNTKQCMDAEIILALGISVMRHDNSERKVENLYSVITRICVIMIMLHTEIAKNSRSDRKRYDIFNERVRHSLDTNAPKSSDQRIDKVFRKMDSIFEKIADCMARDVSKLSLKTLSGEKRPVQITYLYERLKKTFCDKLDMDSSLPREMVNEQAVVKKLPKLCRGLLFRGMALFLRHGLKAVGRRNVQDTCQEICAFFIADTKKSTGTVPEEVISVLAPLLYDKSPLIRNNVNDLFKERGLYPVRQRQFLQEEMKRQLCPLLQVAGESSTCKYGSGWLTDSGTFCDKKVRVVFDENDEENELEEDNPHFRQINALLNLRHENIIKLLAYQVSHVPRFYITEGPIQESLQEALKYGNYNRKYFEIIKLTRFMITASEALKCCHDSGIVHRNLTAASLFLIDGKLLKLGGFELAVSLQGEEYFKDTGKPNIPNRWSAPESLKPGTGKFSIASDVWMFGVLMYEVMTHGALPYSHIDAIYDTLLSMLAQSTDPPRLKQEECFREDQFALMSWCTTVDPKDRPPLSEITDALKETEKKIIAAPTGLQPKFPDLISKRCPSTACERGLDNLWKPVPPKLGIQDLDKTITPTLTRYKKTSEYIFRELVTPKMPAEVTDKINSDEMVDIFHYCIQIRDQDMQTTVIDYHINAPNVVSMKTAVKEKKFGSDLTEYLGLFTQIAHIIQLLHEQDLVLGCLETCHLYLVQQGDERTWKMHIISYANLSTSEPDDDWKEAIVSRILDRMDNKAAPEVRRYRCVSPASDVHNFGVVMLEILSDLIDRNLYFSKETRPMEQLRKLREPIGDKTCLQTCDLIEECIQEDISERPGMEQVVEKLKGIFPDSQENLDKKDRRNVVENPYSLVPESPHGNGYETLTFSKFADRPLPKIPSTSDHMNKSPPDAIADNGLSPSGQPYQDKQKPPPFPKPRNISHVNQDQGDGIQSLVSQLKIELQPETGVKCSPSSSHGKWFEGFSGDVAHDQQHFAEEKHQQPTLYPWQTSVTSAEPIHTNPFMNCDDWTSNTHFQHEALSADGRVNMDHQKRSSYGGLPSAGSTRHGGINHHPHPAYAPRPSYTDLMQAPFNPYSYTGQFNYLPVDSHVGNYLHNFPTQQLSPNPFLNDWREPRGFGFPVAPAHAPQVSPYPVYNPQFQPPYPMGPAYVPRPFTGNPFRDPTASMFGNPQSPLVPAFPHGYPFNFQPTDHNQQSQIPTTVPDCPQGRQSLTDDANTSLPTSLKGDKP